MGWSTEKRHELIKLLKKHKLAEFPTFDCYVDGSGSVYLDDKALIHSSFLKKLLTFCDKNGLSFQMFTRTFDETIPRNRIRIAIFEDEAKGEK